MTLEGSGATTTPRAQWQTEYRVPCVSPLPAARSIRAKALVESVARLPRVALRLASALERRRRPCRARRPLPVGTTAPSFRRATAPGLRARSHPSPRRLSDPDRDDRVALPPL